MTFWIETIERLIRDISPGDFADAPIYIAKRAELDGRFDVGGDACGYTSPFLDLQLEEHLRATNRWAGRGFATVIDEGKILVFAGPLASLSIIHRYFVNLGLHEFAHHCQRGHAQPLFQSPDQWPACLRAALNSSMTETKQDIEPAPESNLPPWLGHKADFIRTALHVQHRANEAGWRMQPVEIVAAGERYGLADIGDYAFALNDEPQQRRNEPLMEVMSSPSPIDFERFAQEDLQRAKEKHHRQTLSLPQPATAAIA